MPPKYHHVRPWLTDPANAAPVANARRILTYTNKSHVDSYSQAIAGMYGLNHINIQLFLIVYTELHSLESSTTISQAVNNVPVVRGILQRKDFQEKITGTIQQSVRNRSDPVALSKIVFRLMQDVYRLMVYISKNEEEARNIKELSERVLAGTTEMGKEDEFVTTYHSTIDIYEEEQSDDDMNRYSDEDYNDVDEMLGLGDAY